jgi:hypothetical protein
MMHATTAAIRSPPDHFVAANRASLLLNAPECATFDSGCAILGMMLATSPVMSRLLRPWNAYA